MAQTRLSQAPDLLTSELPAGNNLTLEFIFFEAHTLLAGLAHGGIEMPLTGSVSEGKSFFCPNCGALYAVTHSRRRTIESNAAKCIVCLQIMDRWNSTNVPIYKLLQRPERDDD
jgi:hypothetical protein